MKNKPTTGDMMIAFVECYIPGEDVREMSALFDEWIAGVRAKAWDEGVTTALNYAKRQPDGITLKLETFDGDEWQNPYRKAVQPE